MMCHGCGEITDTDDDGLCVGCAKIKQQEQEEVWAP